MSSNFFVTYIGQWVYFGACINKNVAEAKELRGASADRFKTYLPLRVLIEDKEEAVRGNARAGSFQ